MSCKVEINKTTKRLLSAMRMGVGFDHADGHRWITWYEVSDRITLKDRLDQENIYPDIKVYGNIIDCLNYIDYLCKLVGIPTLEEQFDKYQDWGLGEEFVLSGGDWENSGCENEKEWERMTAPPIWMRKKESEKSE